MDRAATDNLPSALTVPSDHLAKDRLVSTLFLATLVHGIVIMGVSFSAGLAPVEQSAPTLDVVLMQDRSADAANEDAEYLGAATRIGDGNTRERVRPSSRPASPDPLDSQGDPDSLSLIQRERGAQQPALELVVTRSLSQRSLLSLREAQLEHEQARLMQTSPPSPDPFSDVLDEFRARSEDPRELVTSVDTRESDVAVYLAGWKRKIEQVGTLNFPAEVLQGETLNPVLEVAVDSGGELQDIIVRRSSNIRLVDEAAVRILRLAAPFDPFPPELQEDYDVLRFVYEWQFLRGREDLAAGKN